MRIFAERNGIDIGNVFLTHTVHMYYVDCQIANTFNPHETIPGLGSGFIIASACFRLCCIPPQVFRDMYIHVIKLVELCTRERN